MADDEMSGLERSFASVPPVRAPTVPSVRGRRWGGVLAALAGALTAGVLVRLRRRRRDERE